MSRIDEALRRSGAPRLARSGRGTDDHVFASAWELDDHDDGDREAVASPAGDGRSEGLPHATRSGGMRLLSRPGAIGFREGWRERLVPTAADPGLTEQFRRLAASLLQGQSGGRLKVITVTSAAPNEGKTLTALNLALVLSGSYRRRVLVIDADLRQPKLSSAANGTSGEGLSEALRGASDRNVALVQLTENLSLLPAGRPDPDPLSALTSERMQRLLEQAAELFDWVLIDTPPINAAADAPLLCTLSDATVLVVRAGETPHAMVERAIETIGRDRIFGVVLNGVSGDAAEPYGDYPPGQGLVV